MNSNAVYKKIGALKVVPVIAIDNADRALDLADTLIDGGLPVAEITFRTASAAEVIHKLRSERPNLLVGAGTILNVENLKKAKECGAEFGVAPGLNRELVEEALKLDFPFAPGIMTPSDIEAALSLGLTVLKFFPAEAAGGISLLNSLSAPYKHLGVKFIPTGGVSIANLNNYIAVPTVLAVGGTWVAKSGDISEGNWQKIKNNCKEIRELISG
jgi:2-dehydro-3-deoxyphosphogluconate aldolase/(4S)-4-hydroxy-2-oxoglutarate aldolase